MDSAWGVYEIVTRQQPVTAQTNEHLNLRNLTVQEADILKKSKKSGMLRSLKI